MAIFFSNQKPKSKVLTANFAKRLSALWGWVAVTDGNYATPIEKATGVRFVNVDVSNPQYRISQAQLGAVFSNKGLSTNLNKYLDAYLNETTLVYSDVREREERLNELRFAVTNCAYLGRSVKTVADECTQYDDQDRLISIESPNPQFITKTYELFSKWGLTQSRVHGVCFDLEQYGEAVWTHVVSERGVEKIVPQKVASLRERLEFSPVHMAEVLSQMYASDAKTVSRKSKIDKLVDLLKNPQAAEGLSEDFAEMYNTKLFGYEFDGEVVVPPWLVTHFRYSPDTTEFFPYGSPPLLFSLAPFRQLFTSKALQGLARASSFPVQVYEVKGTEGVGVETAFETVDNVREEYDNIGVTVNTNSIETYTLNTKIWVPEGLVNLKIHKSEVDINFVDDIKMLENEVAVSTPVPRSYIDHGSDGFNMSGISLIEQYKPFAQHVFTIQTAFLQGLGELIRLHYAITGEFDYNTPFLLSMRFPAEDASPEKREGRSASIEMVNSVLELLSSSLGLGEDEALPDEVVSDILAKYSFLDPTDVERWTNLITLNKSIKPSDDEDGDDDDGGDGMDFGGGGGFDMGGGGDSDFGEGDDLGGDEGGDDAGGFDLGGGDAGGDEGGAVEESYANEYYRSVAKDVAMRQKKLAEAKKARLKEKKRLKEQRLREVVKNYKEAKEAIYFNFIKQNNLQEWFKKGTGRHELVIPEINNTSNIWESIQVLNDGEKAGYSRVLRENKETPKESKLASFEDIENIVEAAQSQQIDIDLKKL